MLARPPVNTFPSPNPPSPDFPPSAQFASADRVELVTLFGYLEFCLTQVVQDNELGALREVGARP